MKRRLDHDARVFGITVGKYRVGGTPGESFAVIVNVGSKEDSGGRRADYGGCEGGYLRFNISAVCNRANPACNFSNDAGRKYVVDRGGKTIDELAGVGIPVVSVCDNFNQIIA
jgi:hypothetical protein